MHPLYLGMLTVLTFFLLLFLLISAIYLNIIRRTHVTRNKWHNPIKILLALIYSFNISGFIIAGYLLLSYEMEINIHNWIGSFFIILVILIITSPVIYFSRQLGITYKIPITWSRLGLILLNLYPAINIVTFYNIKVL